MSKRPTFFWSGFAHATQEQALVSLVNRETSHRGRCIVLESYDVRPWMPQSAGGSDTGAPGPFSVSRITAIGNGVDVTAVGHNPAHSLPAAVKIRLQAPVTQTDILSSQIMMPLFSVTSSVLAFPGIVPPLGNHVGRWGARDTSTQGIVLREGTGLALTLGDSPLKQLAADDVCYLTITLVDETNGRSYNVLCELTAPMGDGVGSVAIFNGVGSGIVLSVRNIERSLAGADAIVVPTYIRSMVTRGDDGGGEVVTPIAADPSESVPSWVRLSRGRLGYRCEPRLDASSMSIRTSVDGSPPPSNPFNEQPYTADTTPPATSNTGVASILAIGTLRRALPHYGYRVFKTTDFTGPAFPMAPTTTVSGQAPAKNNDQIIIPPGRGFAIVACNQSSRNVYYVELAFTYRTETTPTARAFA